MHAVKSINDIKSIVLGQPIKFNIKELNLEPSQLFVLIRNLNLNSEDIDLDFSDFENQQHILEQWIISYLQSEIAVTLKTLDIAIVERLTDYIKYWKLDTDGLLEKYNGKYQKFAEDNWALLDELSHFISSSIYYAATLITKNTQLFTDKITTFVSTFKQNGMNIFNYVHDFEVELLLKKFEQTRYIWFDDPKFIQKFLTLAQNSAYVTLMYGQSTPQWKMFQSMLNQV